MTFNMLNSICNNYCNEKNNDLKTNRCDELHKMTNYINDTGNSRFSIYKYGDIIKEVFLVLEIENDLYKNIHINSVISCFNIINTISFNENKLSRIGLYMISCITKNTPIISPNKKTTKITYILPIQEFNNNTSRFNTRIDVNSSYTPSLYVNYTSFNIESPCHCTKDLYYKTNDFCPYMERKYTQVIDQNILENGLIELELTSFKRCIKYYLIYICNLDVEVTNLKLIIHGITKDPNSDIVFNSTIYPKMYYDVEFPHNMFLIPFDNNKNKFPSSYLYDAKTNDLKLEIQFDNNKEFLKLKEIEIVIIANTFTPGYRTIEDYIDNEAYNYTELKDMVNQMYYAPPGISPGFSLAHNSFNENMKRLRQE